MVGINPFFLWTVHLSKSIITASAAKPPVSVVSVSTLLVSLKYFILGWVSTIIFVFGGSFQDQHVGGLCFTFRFPCLSASQIPFHPSAVV